MKVVYLINSLKNPGGMERVLTNKANYFSEKFNYEIFIITTDQNNMNNFYKLNKEITCIDLKINYYEDFKKNILKRIRPFIYKQKKHKLLLEKEILKIKPDFIVSLGCEDTYFLPKLRDESLKIREFHFGKNFRKEYVKSFNKGFLYKVKANLDTLREELLIKEYDKVILLTKEDLKNWKNNSNMEVIPNSISNIPHELSSCENKKIISVGRLDGQKGYDRLVEVWKIVKSKDETNEWILEIYGEGIDKNIIEKKIEDYNLQNSLFLKGVTNKIEEKYQESSIYIMTSRYEGFGMVLIEAMAFGIPAISFDCLSGPSDIIKNGVDGYLIENGNIEEMAEKINHLIKNKTIRKQMGENARKNIERFSNEVIMNSWKELFEKIKIIKRGEK